MPNAKVVGIIFPYILTPIPNLYDHSFPRYGQITFLTFRRPTTLTFDLKFWKYLSYPYVICMPSFIMIGWEMAEILHFEILRKHGQTNTHTNKQTHRHGHYNTSPSPYGGRGNESIRQLCLFYLWLMVLTTNTFNQWWYENGYRNVVSHPLLLANLYIGTWRRGGGGIRRSHFVAMAQLKAELWLVRWYQNKHGGPNESNKAFVNNFYCMK